MSVHSTIYEGNTHVVEVLNLVDGDGNVQSDATVTLETIVDVKTDTEVSGITFPVTLSLVAVDTGDYRAVLPYDAGFLAGRLYAADLIAVSAEGYRAEWTERIVAKKRSA